MYLPSISCCFISKLIDSKVGPNISFLVSRKDTLPFGDYIHYTSSAKPTPKPTPINAVLNMEIYTNTKIMHIKWANTNVCEQ